MLRWISCLFTSKQSLAEKLLDLFQQHKLAKRLKSGHLPSFHISDIPVEIGLFPFKWQETEMATLLNLPVHLQLSSTE